ncbi:MAG: acyl-CoA dehydratase activase-related protein, partial [Bacilli bacterium]
MKKLLKIGIDIGSTTVKVVVSNNNMDILYSDYKRHYSNTKKTTIDLLKEITNVFPKEEFYIVTTGSGAITLSKYLGIPFIQEVIACKNAINKYAKTTDVAIELGGEDAKIIYFDHSIEQRMNGTCAGGTGSFLDQMAILLNTDTKGLNDLAEKGTNIYPVASRCGVFAKTDVQPLLNEGARKEDIALSILQAVVNQTISGLACGRPIKGNVIFLGGPLNYLPILRNQFIKTLNLKESNVIIPKNGELFVCIGALLDEVKSDVFNKKAILNLIKRLNDFKEDTSVSLEPLFKNEEEYNKFIERHSKNKVEKINIKNYKGDVFVGIDAGSTTAKVVAITEKGELLYENYKSNKGTPVDTIKDMLIDLFDSIPNKIRLAGSTGYGEMLVKTAFNLDISEIETMAHYEAANFFLEGVESIIDIGGQDMKYIKIKDGAVDTIMLNEACSSGCGSFIETMAKSLNMTVEDFVNLAIFSKSPIDLGSRCTVFMNSKIKQTQKEGRPLGDIFAGLSYSVIKNAITKVMKIRDLSTLGDKIVVQGGTFLNDAVLRAFEIIIGKEVVRPNIAGLMGAYGVALIALENYKCDKTQQSKMISKEELLNLTVKTSQARCNKCENHCSLTVNTFGKKKFISGNRCERGTGANINKNLLPNMFSYKYDRLFNYISKKGKRGTIGIPRVLNMYENYPLWHTILTELGFEVILSDASNRAIFELGIESMPSESVCYPAKLVHGHIINLINKGIDTIFYPCIMFEKQEFKNSDNCYNCPIVTSYSEAIKLNVEEIKDIKFINSFLPMDELSLYKRIMELEEFKCYHFKSEELKKAIKKGFEEQNKFKEDITIKGKEYIEYIKENNLKAIVLAGRPYHLDKEVNHGIDTMINSLGLAVLTEDSVCYLSEELGKLRVVDQWTYHSRVYHAADVVSKHDFLELINLNSFGCGLDAIITDQTEEILKKSGKLYTTIKIDEINNLGAAKIRIRSLMASMDKRINKSKYELYDYKKNTFTNEMKKRHTILCPDMTPFHMGYLASSFNSSGYNIKYLNETTKEMMETGLKYVNNDACYPAIIVIGQLIYALKSGEYDLNNTSVIMSQTGGGCRATNYIGLIRKALKDAGLQCVPIISFNVSGLEKEQGFKITPSLANKLVMSVIYGDLLMKLVYQTRPYETTKGRTNKLYKKWDFICNEAVKKGSFKEFKENINLIVKDFNSISIQKKNLPKVGIVGEILIKYHLFGNNNLASELEKEGSEVVIPELMGFVKYCAYNSLIKEKILKTGKKSATINNIALSIIDKYEEVVIKALNGSKFRMPPDIKKLEENVKGILSTGNQTGEGWFLTAEIVENLKNGVNNIVCVQPFACLPNHIVGKAVIKKIRTIYKDANIIAIDYDPGASRTNQANRIKLMLTV